MSASSFTGSGARVAPLVVAIDGPSASGKSTVARRLARRLGIPHIDTGAMYRALTWLALEEGIDVGDRAALEALARNATIRLAVGAERGQSTVVSINGRDLGRELRSTSVTRAVSAVSAVPGVRRVMVRLQRSLAREGGVLEGRDTATAVVPGAPVKVFLTASAEERTRRRGNELGLRHSIDEVQRDLARRDALDSTRPVSPLRPAADAVLLDTSGLSISEVVDRIAALVVEVAEEGGRSHAAEATEA